MIEMTARMSSAFVLIVLIQIMQTASTLDERSAHLTTLFNQRDHVAFLLSKRMMDKSKWLFEGKFCKDAATKQPLPHDQLPICFEMRFVPQGRVLEALTWLLANSDRDRFAGWYCKNPTPPKEGGRPGRDHTGPEHLPLVQPSWLRPLQGFHWLA